MSWPSIAFLIFIVWIGSLPASWFSLMDTTVASLVNDLGAGVLGAVR